MTYLVAFGMKIGVALWQFAKFTWVAILGVAWLVKPMTIFLMMATANSMGIEAQVWS